MTVVADMTPFHSEAERRGLRPVRMLTVLDAAAERGLVAGLPAVLDTLEQNTPFYVSKACKRVIEDMKQRDQQRKLGTPRD